MTDAGSRSESPALRLARYLKEFVGIRSTTVRDINKYESVLWFSEMPQEPDCWSGAWSDESDPEAPWLEVRKQQFETIPALPSSVEPWGDQRALRQATQTIPPLHSSIWVDDTTIELAEDETPPQIELHLSDRPEIQQAYELYRPKWEAWSKEHRRRESIQKVYADLFRLHTQLRKESELVELVLGIGLITWRPKLEKASHTICRHAVVARAELEFLPESGLIRVLPPADGARLRIEDDMLEAELRPAREHYASLQDHLDEIGDQLWDKALTFTALQTWAQALTADAQWSPTLGSAPAQDKALVISFRPALILRKRAQTGMVRIYESLIEQLVASPEDVPIGWAGLVDDLDDQLPSEEKDVSRSSTEAGSTEIYFPLPANREQRCIVEAIQQKRGVLVQGPPGTGKSHTIANLICHLLATGQRVLVTAETARALQVLKDKLPDAIKPLCVSLLGQGSDEFSELNKAVQGITNKQATYSPGAYDRRIEEIDNELDQVRREMAATDTELRSLREEETCPHSVAHGTYTGTASKIAARVASERNQFGWLKLSKASAEENPCASQELLAWYDTLCNYTPEQVESAGLQTPSSKDLPSPASLIQAITVEKEKEAESAHYADLRSHPAYSILSGRSPEKRARLRAWLKKLGDDHQKLTRLGMDWVFVAVREIFTGRASRWETIAELTNKHLADIETILARLGSRVVSLTASHNRRKVRADAETALAYLRSGGSWKRFGFITPGEIKHCIYLTKEVLVDGNGSTTPEHLQVVCDYLAIECSFEELGLAWQSVTPGLPHENWRLRVADLKEQQGLLESVRKFAGECLQVTRDMASTTPPLPSPDWIGNDLPRWISVIDAITAEDRYRDAKRIVQDSANAIHALRALHNVHPVVDQLARVIESRDVTEYSAAYAQLQAIETIRINLENQRAVEAKLRQAVPGFVEIVTRTVVDQGWTERLQHWESAWNWALADLWLEKRANLTYQQELWARRHQIDEKIGGLLAEAASLRAWKHFFARLSTKEANALKAWRETVKAMGKGTGRSSKLARLRRDARQYMDECRSAIPIWIMPRYLVAEMVDPKPHRYDHIIVDEASQLGVESLFLFYIGDKMIVVGDDQQISPYGVGVADEAISGLQDQYLEGIRYRSILSAQSSLYANAKVRYERSIVLREHFRCMPEIIQFSNDLCYAANGTPLDPLRAYPANRLKPLVLRHVPDGYRKGSGQNIANPPEAEAIVAQIVACIKDSRYKDATMGVISLQGEAQAKLIERMLLDQVDPEVIEARRLICGDAYAFQGDERDIIFMSLVAAKDDKRIGTLATDSAKQRFNVAASRARDQLWLFHSATLDVLSTKCIRHRLLSYFMNPIRQATEEGKQAFDSEFERQVFQMITARGFHVRTQVCVGDPTNHRYRIDLVVEGMQGRLAVECDGDAWHGPDRYEYDMARQRDLERAGWQFVHIRGGDFYRDPEEAMRPLWTELDQLGIRPGGIDEAAAEPPAPMISADMIHHDVSTVVRDIEEGADSIGENEDEDSTGDDVASDEEENDEAVEGDNDSEYEGDDEEDAEENGEDGEEDDDDEQENEYQPDHEPAPALAPTPIPIHRPILVATPPAVSPGSIFGTSKPFVTKAAKTLVAPPNAWTNPQGDLFNSSSVPQGHPSAPLSYVAFHGETGPDPRTVDSDTVAQGLCRIIACEGPMLARRAYIIYLRGCGIQRMGKELQKSMNKALQQAIRMGLVVKEDESGTGGLVHSIVRVTGMPPLKVRERGPRTFEEIPPSEVQIVARYLVDLHDFQPGSEEHLRAILDHFGLIRLTAKTVETLSLVLKRPYAYVTEFENGAGLKRNPG